MARLARVVLPGYPHHIIQRGNRRQDVFLVEEDYEQYLQLLKTWCFQEKIEIWAYCLMTNHVHLIVTIRYLRLGCPVIVGIVKLKQALQYWSTLCSVNNTFFDLFFYKIIKTDVSFLCSDHGS